MELRQYLRILRAHWLGILILTVLGVGLAYGASLLQPRIYTADATAVAQATSTSTEISAALAGDSLATSRVKTYVDIGTSRSVAQRVIDELGIDTSTQALVNRVSVTNPLDTLSLRVSAEARSPEEARDISEAWVRAMAAEVNQLESGDDQTRGSVYLQPIDSAKLPTEPTSPNVQLYVALGGLVGLVVGIAYAFLRYTLDRRIRSADGVERETGIAVVGTIPEEKSFTAESRLIPFDGGGSAGGKKSQVFAVAEAMRELRTNINFMDVDNPPRVIVVTSPLPGDGKSTTASNLAITLASSGQNVVLIDGDLRRPMVASVFGLVGAAGLTDVLSGRAELADVAQRVGSGNLMVVASGKLPPNPSEVLGSDRMKELISVIAREAYVIIDAPPLIPVTDAAVLAHGADGAIVVGTVGKTTYEMLQKALINLSRANARALGIVLNRVPRRGSSSYGYRYQGDYYRNDAADMSEAIPVTMSVTRSNAEAGGSSERRAARQ